MEDPIPILRHMELISKCSHLYFLYLWCNVQGEIKSEVIQFGTAVCPIILVHLYNQTNYLYEYGDFWTQYFCLYC